MIKNYLLSVNVKALQCKVNSDHSFNEKEIREFVKSSYDISGESFNPDFKIKDFGGYFMFLTDEELYFSDSDYLCMFHSGFLTVCEKEFFEKYTQLVKGD